MIEDDLRQLMQSLGMPIYARIIPTRINEAISIQATGGQSIKAGIRRASQTVTLLSASRSKADAMRNLALARDYLITHIPADINGTHYYTATPADDGSTQSRQMNGLYIEYCTLGVVLSV